MSFTISLQYNSSERTKVTKTIQDVITLSGTLKEQTSVTDPTILVEYAGTLPQVNYMTIPEFHRSYFITGIESVRENLWRISAHVDVLSTYAAQIRNNTAIIQRQENDYNLLLDDGVFRSYQDPLFKAYNFQNGFGNYELVLAVAGG